MSERARLLNAYNMFSPWKMFCKCSQHAVNCVLTRLPWKNYIGKKIESCFANRNIKCVSCAFKNGKLESLVSCFCDAFCIKQSLDMHVLLS